MAGHGNVGVGARKWASGICRR